MNTNTYYHITVKCNNCGEEIGFYPHMVLVMRGCSCGNADYGSPRGWNDKKFGNFTFVKDGILQYAHPSKWRHLFGSEESK